LIRPNRYYVTVEMEVELRNWPGKREQQMKDEKEVVAEEPQRQVPVWPTN